MKRTQGTKRTKGPQRIQLSRAKGWRMPANTVKVDRTTRWGNPFKAEKFHFGEGKPPQPGMNEWMCQLFEKAIGVAHVGNGNGLPTFVEIQMALRGKNLACWCKLDAPCHADVLLRIANAPRDERSRP